MPQLKRLQRQLLDSGRPRLDQLPPHNLQAQPLLEFRQLRPSHLQLQPPYHPFRQLPTPSERLHCPPVALPLRYVNLSLIMNLTDLVSKQASLSASRLSASLPTISNASSSQTGITSSSSSQTPTSSVGLTTTTLPQPTTTTDSPHEIDLASRRAAAAVRLTSFSLINSFANHLPQSSLSSSRSSASHAAAVATQVSVRLADLSSRRAQAAVSSVPLLKKKTQTDSTVRFEKKSSLSASRSSASAAAFVISKFLFHSGGIWN